MREIIFRGKRIDNGEWVYGDLSQHKTGKKFIKTGSAVHSFEVIPETVGQFTGLTDKNGKKIFEGDVHCHYNERQGKNRYFIIKHGDFHDTVYSFDSYGWHFEEINGENIEALQGNEHQYANIIGNIHDNLELLEDSKQ